jgi:hypothetical protein
MPVILATQEAEIRRITVQSQQGQIFSRSHLEKTLHKKGLVEWFKVKTQSSYSSTKKKKKKQTKNKETKTPNLLYLQLEQTPQWLPVISGCISLPLWQADSQSPSWQVPVGRCG